MAFNHKHNTDSSVIHAMTVGLIKTLHDRMSYYNQWSDDEKVEVKIPFYYGFSSDERFIQDYFEQGLWSDCYPNWIEGNYDPIPRGHIMNNSINILPSELTSRYVRGYYTREEDGQLKRYNSYINSIPIQINFDVKILVDWSDITHFKVIESAFRTLWNTIVFNVSYDGFMIPCRAGFPESYTYDKLFEYTYQTNDQRTPIMFTIEAHGFLPIPDAELEFFAGKNIQAFNANIGPQGPSGGSPQNGAWGPTNQAGPILFPPTNESTGNTIPGGGSPGSGGNDSSGSGSGAGAGGGNNSSGTNGSGGGSGAQPGGYTGDPNYWE